MTARSDFRNRRPVLVGGTLVILGALFLLREVGVVPDISSWTLFWLAIGGFLFGMTIAGGRRGWFAPLAVFGVGLLMLLQDLEVVRRGFAIWPVVVIALGLAMLLDARGPTDSDAPQAPG